MASGPPSLPIIVALGGNAISPARVRDSIGRQFEQTRRTMEVLVDLLLTGPPVIITHGNGPQIGSALRRNELSAPEVYGIPLDVLVADLQGGMGYMITECLMNVLHGRGTTRSVTTVITTVEVAADDPSFDDPSKPIGPFYDADRAGRLRERGWGAVEIPDQGFRRVVPSPRPRSILEIDTIRRLLRPDEIIIAAGGGGIPVARSDDGTWRGREAVVDKDLATGLLASEVGAKLILMVTGVESVRLDFGQPAERALRRLSATDARGHLADGQFPRGSMGPKIEAAADFLERSAHANPRVVVTDIDHIPAALAGDAGTTITR